MVPVPPASDFQALLARAKAGDVDCLEHIIRQTETRLRTSIDQRLGAKLRASLRRSDVLQNAYLVMLEALPTFTGSTEPEFVAWLTRIIQHDILRQNRWFGAARRRAPTRTSERNALAEILLDRPATPTAEAAGRERDQEVRDALARLEPDHAQVIELALLQQLPHREVAQRLNRSEGACRMLLLRARAALAIALDKLAADD